MSEKKKKGRKSRGGYQPTLQGLKGKDGKPFDYSTWKDLKLPKWDTAIVPPKTEISEKPRQP